MNVDEPLLNRLREALVAIEDVQEKKMFGGVCFMVKGIRPTKYIFSERCIMGSFAK